MDDDNDDVSAYSIEEYSGQPRGIEVPAAQHVVQDAVKIAKDHADQSPDVAQPNADAAVGADTTDAHSIRSMPDTPVAPPVAAVPPRPATARTVQNAPVRASQSASVRQPAEHRSVERRARHRHRPATTEQRATNRLSGFFTNLIHRRDPPPTSSRSTIREEAAKDDPSRSASPHSGRPVTPPPQLPAPTLQELGLSLSVLTQDLSPSHFTTPPTSGAFLAPHYLLLCHAQGLDVLPLVAPPTPQPYALVRRVPFKSVVVMEQRGVLVAIAGRRDGVRVYALEEIRKAVEWRVDVEVRRERDRSKRDAFKKTLMSPLDTGSTRDSSEKSRKGSLSSPSQAEETDKDVSRRPSHSSLQRSRPNTPTPSNPPPHPSEQPPPYSRQSDPEGLTTITPSASETVLAHNHSRSRGNSVSNVLAAVPSVSRRPPIPERDSKADWAEDSSDDEAINIVAAAGGSQALDERTSSVTASTSHAAHLSNASSTASRPSTGSAPRRNRPANLDLSMSRANGPIPDPEPSPAPTLITLRQALSHTSSTERNAISTAGPDTPNDPEADDDDDDNGLSLAEMLMESRLPELPPAGSRRDQEPILLSNQAGESETEPSSPRTVDGFNTARRASQESSTQQSQTGRRRRWSVMLSPPNQPLATSVSTPTSPASTRSRGRGLSPGRSGSRALSQTRSQRSARSPQPPLARPPTAPSPSSALAGLVPSTSMPPPSSPVPPLPDSASSMISSRSSRFIPRIISNAFGARRSDDRTPLPSSQRASDTDSRRTANSNQTSPHAPPPKLEYVKLPGTKGALMVKAVETAKKSFLAILCGDNGEKVELFAGTYRTALGLSRTFILPDSPRLLELQLQGDDLVEVFLVFSQNVFGLEPATVRVREVRIGRAERRAARRRAREIRTGETQTDDAAAEEETNVNVTVSVAVTDATPASASGPGTPPLVADQHPEDQPATPAAEPTTQPSAASHADELLALASAQMGPYTTFQQLSFAPKFPLAAIADDYIIPPTYPEFIDYRNHHESDSNGADLTRIQFSPPGLPVPTPSAPCKWFYRDPKGVVHGPWKASLMQAWFKDGLLPLDLPVRREEDSDYILLKDLRLQCVDPTRPFRSPVQTAAPPPPFLPDAGKPLLAPISLLAQPKHFGPPALFFSSRGGHSTAIVDARGRSVLKGRFLWSSSDPDEDKNGLNRLGDVKRLEAFDVEDGAVLVAMRQGGLEAVDFSDALLKPADASRTVLPQFEPPPSNINRRSPFVWRIGTPVDVGSSSIAMPLSSKGGKGSSYLSGRKPGSTSTRNLVRTELHNEQLVDADPTEEVLFLGRRGDNMYMCERSAGSFRILHLRPSQPSPA
ncbi:hypothetical protein HDZ31DRAFT_45353 [Schizophyllum fasciatum]